MNRSGRLLVGEQLLVVEILTADHRPEVVADRLVEVTVGAELRSRLVRHGTRS